MSVFGWLGVLSPHTMKYFVTQVQSRIKKRLEAHFHQDFGMGVANTIMALSPEREARS
ncbi:MAG: hypothetical protein HY269_04420 [Deltaproteobacteria bacterium]|nr:hypothetical protein [Deltaproteobacteria bacterium]